MYNKAALLVLVILCFINIKVQALTCYTCTASNEHVDQECITDPNLVQVNPITNCNKKYCISIRNEYIDPKNKVESMSRTCVDKPLYTNEIIEAGEIRTYYRACQTDLCNGGSGKSNPSKGGPYQENGEDIVLLVKGIIDPSKASTLSAYTFLVTIAVIFSNNLGNI